jgi:HlyD family secretion protein
MDSFSALQSFLIFHNSLYINMLRVQQRFGTLIALYQYMDIPRKSQTKLRWIRRVIVGLVLFGAVGGISWYTAHLKPASPSVERANVWIDTVRRGPMVLQVRGMGRLTLEEIRWIPAAVDGRVEKLLVAPGARVEPETVLIELSNPQLEHETLDAEWVWRMAETALDELEVKLEGQRLTRSAEMARIESEHQQASLNYEATEELARDGLVPGQELRLKKAAVDQLVIRLETERRQTEISQKSDRAQLAVQRVRVDQARAIYELRRGQLEQLKVRAGMDGVLQQLPVEVGQRIGTGSNLARVANPARLKAEISIAETQARDIQLGQEVAVDTRNGIVPGKVARIDPAVKDGAVTVDVRLEGALPRGARPDLSVDGTVVLERLDDVIYVGRPVQSGEDGKISLFKLDGDGRYATRVTVRLGRSSVNVVEVREGLVPDDQVILSDMAGQDGVDRIQLR